jgi:hypothetical protein
VHQGDVGAPIRFDLVDEAGPFDLTNATRVELWIRQPSKRVLVRAMDVVDPEAGSTYYATVSGDLAEWGRYRFQVRAIMPAGPIAFDAVDQDVGKNVFPSPLLLLPDPARAWLAAPEAVVS